MLPHGDWKWKTALGAFTVAAAAAVLWPLPDPPPPPPRPSAPMSSMTEEEPAPEFDEESMLTYTVQDGDTPEEIARLFVIRLDHLLAVNHLPPSGDFEPGRRIWIPPAVE
jgi:hypothetical protein